VACQANISACEGRAIRRPIALVPYFFVVFFAFAFAVVFFAAVFAGAFFAGIIYPPYINYVPFLNFCQEKI